MTLMPKSLPSRRALVPLVIVVVSAVINLRLYGDGVCYYPYDPLVLFLLAPAALAAGVFWLAAELALWALRPLQLRGRRSFVTASTLTVAVYLLIGWVVFLTVSIRPDGLVSSFLVRVPLWVMVPLTGHGFWIEPCTPH